MKKCESSAGARWCRTAWNSSVEFLNLVFQLSSSELAAFQCIGDTRCSDVFSKILLNPLELKPESSAADDVLNIWRRYNHVSARDSKWPALQLASFRSTAGGDSTEQKLLRTLPPPLWAFTFLVLHGDSFVHLIPGFHETPTVRDADPNLGLELILDWQSPHSLGVSYSNHIRKLGQWICSAARSKQPTIRQDHIE